MLIADAAPGEDVAVFIAGVLALAGTFVALFAIWSAHKQKPYLWQLGFISIAFTSLGTALGLWKLAGESGWAFLGLAVLLAAGAIFGAMAWGRKWPVPPLQDVHIKEQEDEDAKGK